jgi:putative tryptophan/tyrosine transport system substrate-binding protein
MSGPLLLRCTVLTCYTNFAILGFGVSAMKRREFITLVGGAVAAWPLPGRAQQAAMPVIGFLSAGSPGGVTANPIAAFRRVLADNGYVEGQSVTIEYRYAAGQYDRLPDLAADLVSRHVSVIVATPNANCAYAAKAATTTIPILFMASDDPSKLGLVASLSRPGGNATGVNYFLTELVAKRLELLRELVPTARRVGVLVNPNSASTAPREAMTAASSIGLHSELVQARDAREIEAAFATFVHNSADGLLVLPDTFFADQRVQIATLAARHAIPAIYTVREYVEAGGLISYGPDLREPFRQLGLYTARILKGAKPADLPVVQVTKIELVINLKAANSLGLQVPQTLLATADEVIE